jgi:adenosylcobinamide kinase / adenosylcobinamide-phosphate guanylyltransferase
MAPAVHLVLGGARSGKSRHAESLAAGFEQQGLQVVFVPTAWPADEEMRQRIARHQLDRPASWHTVQPEARPGALAALLRERSAPSHCLVVDCLTLWLTQLMCPPPGVPVHDEAPACEGLLQALAQARGPVVLVSNEIGWGVTPLGRETRAFVDALGRLHQGIAALASHVTLVVAGIPMAVKGPGSMSAASVAPFASISPSTSSATSPASFPASSPDAA